jgi:hypothetical protein
MLLKQLQSLLNRIYDTSVDLDVYDFLVTERERLPASADGCDTPTDEQLLVGLDGDTLGLSLYLDAQVLDRLAQSDPLHALDSGNVADYWTALEGVSHFQYLAWNARHDRPVSLHELEVQGEVDKYAATLFLLGEQHAGRFPSRLHHWLFGKCRPKAELEVEQRDLYESANRYAARFCRALERRFLERGRVRCEALVRELRAFYRLTHAPKIRLIEAA